MWGVFMTAKLYDPARRVLQLAECPFVRILCISQRVLIHEPVKQWISWRVEILIKIYVGFRVGGCLDCACLGYDEGAIWLPFFGCRNDVYTEDRFSILLRNIGNRLSDYTLLQLVR
jgi:hypothetical protein